MLEYYLEDLKIGDRFASAPYIVTEAAIIDFAREFDPQPFHLDAERGKESVLEGLAASGWHTAAITMRLFVTSGLNFAGGSIGLGVDELRWSAPVRPGDTLRLEMEIVEARPSKSMPSKGIVRILNVMKNQNDEIVETLLATVLILRRQTV
jgi:acyl dehydratase